MTGPLYVEIENYTDVLDELDNIKTNILRAAELIEEVHSLREEEMGELEAVEEFMIFMQEKVRVLNEELMVR